MFETPIVNEAAFYCFAGLSLWGIAQGVWRPYLFATFPVIASCVWSAYILPQAYGILYNPWWLPPEAYYPGFAWTMLMACLCILAGNAGWASGAGRGNAARSNLHTRIAPERLLFIGLSLAVIGVYAKYQIAEMTGGIVTYYSIDGNYTLDWLGEEVILAFVARICQITSIPILSYLLFREQKMVLLAALLFAVAFPVADIIFLTRRSEVVFLALAVALPLFFARGWTPSRPVMTLAVCTAMVVVFVFPVFRGMLLIGATGANIGDVQVVDTIVDNVLLGQEVKEFNNSIGIVASFQKTGNFTYGLHLFDSWVQTTVPRSLLGSGVKEALVGDTITFEQNGLAAFGWRPVSNHSVAAVARLFSDFFIFGALAFFVIGRAFRVMYEKAIRDSAVHQIQYAIYAVLLPHWVAIGFAKMLREIVIVFIVTELIKAVASRRPRSRPDGDDGSALPETS